MKYLEDIEKLYISNRDIAENQCLSYIKHYILHEDYKSALTVIEICEKCYKSNMIKFIENIFRRFLESKTYDKYIQYKLFLILYYRSKMDIDNMIRIENTCVLKTS